MSHDSPISLHGTGPTLAKQAVQAEGGHWPLPEGTMLASLPKRGAAWMLDWILIMAVLGLLTKFRILGAYQMDLAIAPLNWAIIAATYYLYHKYALIRFGRSLGQRWFGLAVVMEDGGAPSRDAAGARAWRKLVYAFPIVQLIFFFRHGRQIHTRHTHQSNIDLVCATAVVVANSLPPARRRHLR